MDDENYQVSNQKGNQMPHKALWKKHPYHQDQRKGREYNDEKKVSKGFHNYT